MRQRSVLMVVVLVVVLILYVASLSQPAILFRLASTAGGHVQMQAGTVVRSGAKMVFLSLFGPFLLNFAVLANPLLVAGGVLLLRRRTRAALVSLAVAALLALQTFQLLIFPIPEDEGGVMHAYMVRPLAGWYCWFAAILLALALALYSHFVPEQELGA